MFRLAINAPRMCRQVGRQLEIFPCRTFMNRDDRHVPMFSQWNRKRKSSFWDRLVPLVVQELDSKLPELRKEIERAMPQRNFDRYEDNFRYRQRGDRCRVDRRRGDGHNSEVTEVRYDNKTFEVKLDVRQFEPENINVKISENRLIISGKQEQKADEHGFVSREFTREFLIPENVDTETICSSLSDEGLLLVQGKVKGAEEVNERVINIDRNSKSTINED